jgi:hypothetical protein
MAEKVARMSPQTEQRIADAVESAIDKINAGERPNDAIVKVAVDDRLPAGHVRLLVNAYNTARTNRQRTTNQLLMDKAAEFPLADAGEILGRVFPQEVKSAAAVERETGVHTDYAAGPHWYHPPTTMTKAAEAPRLVERAPEPYPSDPVERMKRAYHESRWRDREIEEARREFSAAQDGLVECFQKLARYFQTPGSLAIADVRDNVEALYGVAGTAVLHHLERTRPLLAKKAATQSGLLAVDRRREPYRTIEDAIGRTAKIRDSKNAFEEISVENGRKTAEALAPFAQARRESPLGLLSGASSVKQAGAYGTAVGVQLTRDALGRIGDGFRSPDRESLVNKHLRDISTPEHEQQLRGIQTQAMLQDMLANDPVISSYNPHEVTDAFNQVSQLAPNAAGQPAVMGPLLRKWLSQGAIDTFEGTELIGNEHKLKQIREPAHPPAAAKPPEKKPGLLSSAFQSG